jgi:hypothetical protein
MSNPYHYTTISKDEIFCQDIGINFIGFFCFDVHVVILINEFQFFYITSLGNSLCHVPKFLLIVTMYVHG